MSYCGISDDVTIIGVTIAVKFVTLVGLLGLGPMLY